MKKITADTPIADVQAMMEGGTQAEAYALRHWVVARELDTSAMTEREWSGLLGFAMGYVVGASDASNMRRFA